MLFSRGFSRIARIPRNSLSSCRWFLFHRHGHQPTFRDSNAEEQHDPFPLVADELSLITMRLRSMVVTEVPKLSSAAGYFFKVEGKKLCPMVLLLMAMAFNVCKPELPSDRIGETLTSGLRRDNSVASLIHDDVLDDALTRRSIGSLSFAMGNKLAILAGDLLISRAFVALASLRNTEAVSLMATAVKNLVSGETMQMTATSEQRYSMEYYMQKTYNKTAALVSNSCKAIAYLSDQKEEVATLAFEYGKNLFSTSASLGKGSLTDIQHGIITAPVLFTMEEFPQLREVVDSGFDNPANIDIVLEYLGKSNGIQRTRELAVKHANLAAAAIDSLPETNDVNARKSRRALNTSHSKDHQKE